MLSANRNRIITIIAITIVIVAMIAIGFFTTQKPKQNTLSNNSSGQTLDKNSGDTIVSNPQGRTPETFGAPSDAPLFLGVQKFLDFGLSDIQVSDLKYAFYQYAKSANPKITQVSITVNSITAVPHDRYDPSQQFVMTFDLIFNGGNIKTHAKIVYSDTNSIELYLMDNSGKIVFDSGIVTNKSLDMYP